MGILLYGNTVAIWPYSHNHMDMANRPGKNWDLRILDPEEHFSISPN
jgi:hypothetical protein